MSHLIKTYYKLLNFPINLLVRSRSIPVNPIEELGLNPSHCMIYVLPYNSKTDLLTLRSQCLEHKLPDPIEPLIIDGKKFPRHIFIHKNILCMRNYHLSKKVSVKLFHNYLDLCRSNPELDMQIVPVSVMFGRRPDRRESTINPLMLIILMRIRKFFAVTWLGRDSFVRFSRSISLNWVISEYDTDKTITYKLIRVANIHFTRQRLAAVGPCLPDRQNLFKKLLSSQTIDHAIKDEANGKKISYKKAQQNAISFMKEIAANFSYETVRLTDRILRFTWNRLYQEINVNNAERIRKIAHRGHEIVYIPCHRSHMDYLLLSYVIYHQGLVPPHIAAGINLNFWPAGPIFRRLGAFFIRRTFKGNKLYSAVFREYFNELFRLGYSVEFFVEGGRSRTGLLLEPKTGTLSMTVQAMLQGRTRPITLVPIYIGYEHVIEVVTYTKELSGALKKKENLLQVLKGLSRLRNLGQSYVNFGEPLSLSTWLNQNVPDWKKSIDQIKYIRPVWLTKKVNDIASDLMIRINSAVATNAINLCCTALLASRKHSLTRTQLVEQIDCYLNLMRNVPYSKDIIIPSVSAKLLIEHALKVSKFKIEKGPIEDVIVLPNDQSDLLNYYRNNIYHTLILPSLLAAIITQHHYVSYNRILRYVRILYPMLKSELFLRWNINDLTIELLKFTNELIRQKLVLLEKDQLYVNPSRSYTLQLLASDAQDIIHRYTIVFWLLSNNPTLNRTALEKKSRVLAQKLSVIGNSNVMKFFEKTTFQKFFFTLHEEGYLKKNQDIELGKIKEVYQILSGLITSDVQSEIENTNIASRYL